uniref:PIPK domain-containing protein n=1 Tax=Palpitomonas bilix TaxID=652834 RepID=A0A7S3LTG6_9EUKA|mmetsp:Transcript_45813/g.118403  ORF Transcript_45813/g.118403 Transcript_45813/m.118403 type:complete len:314 (+) Transcript_45813:228-1169(+)
MAEEFFPEEEPPSTFEARNIIDVSVRRASTVALPSSIVGASSVEAPAPVTPVSTRKPGLGSLPEDVEVDGSIKDSRRSSLQGQPRRTRSKTWALGVDDLSEQAEKNLHDWEESVGDSDTDSAKRVRSNKKARPGSEAATPSTVRAGAVSPSRRTTTDQPHYTERRKLKIRHKLNAVGEVIYKGHTSYMIMKCIQMGVRVTVGQITPLEQRDLTVEDFASYIKQAFPTTGTETTPPHGFQDFKFKDYSPMVFRHLRERFRIDPADYMVSLCGDDALRILPTPGKSGALFFFSEDQKYIIKTLPKRESKLLRQVC